jgi:SulP family sulfate permease
MDKDSVNREMENGAIPLEEMLPGEEELKQTVKAHRYKLPKKSTMSADANAGLTKAMNEIPSGMACGQLAGVSPVMGLFACVCGNITGGFFNSTKLMIVSTTSASAFMVYQITQVYAEEQRVGAVVLLVLLAGLFMIVLGLLKLGNLVRFVSFPVMTGFLAGISILAILSQLPTFFGFEATGSNKIMQTVDLIQNIRLTNWHALIPGIATVVFMVLLPKTPLGQKSALVSVALPSLFIFIMKWNDVEVVSNVGEISSGLPSLHLPDFWLINPSLISGAFSLALITLIQGAGVSQSVPNPDGSRSSTSKDFVSQGIANVSSSLIGGIGVGGSVGSTALNIVAGARSRLASIFAGVFMLVLVVLVPGLVGQVAMPVLAGVMIFAMASSLRPQKNKQVWNAGWAARIGLISTLLVTLFWPIQYAVLVGVMLSFVMYFFMSSRYVKLHRIRLMSDGRFEQIPVPVELESEKVHVFSVDGSLHFAGARMLENQWPKIGTYTRRPVIVLEMQGLNNVGATLTEVLLNYYHKIEEAGGRFYITELEEHSYSILRVQAASEILGGMRISKQETIIGESTRHAILEARAWLGNYNLEK